MFPSCPYLGVEDRALPAAFPGEVQQSPSGFHFKGMNPRMEFSEKGKFSRKILLLVIDVGKRVVAADLRMDRCIDRKGRNINYSVLPSQFNGQEKNESGFQLSISHLFNISFGISLYLSFLSSI